MTKNAKKSATKVNAKAKKSAAPAKVNVSAEASKQNAKRTAQPGVIGTIMSTLEDAKKHKKPVTADDILKQLTKTFPDRPQTGMMITVRAQLSRLPKEKEFAINKVREGRVVKYIAA